jgi:tripartite-type tricarboxylate transporter receptor subunit TctC
MKAALAALVGVTVILGIGGPAGAAQPESYPQRPIRFVVPFAPGGTTDIIARIVGSAFSEDLGQQVIVDNRGGAGSTIGIAIAAKSAPDGYTIVLSNNGLAINETLYEKLPYNAMRDLAPISLVGETPNVLIVNPAVAAKSVKEFVALAKEKPGKLAYASAGNGSSTHLSVELFESMTGIKTIHVPYKGGAPALNDTISGQVQFMLATLPSVHGHIVSGRVRALGVSGKERSASLPGVPTIAQSGFPGYVYTSWYGIMAPTGTPATIIKRLNEATFKALNTAVSDRLKKQGLDPRATTPEAFREMIGAEIAVWQKIIKAANIIRDSD